jgi:hypothetical protein
MFNFNEIKNALMETTPICDDAINIIMDMVKPPTFEVGKIYFQIYHWSDGHGGRVYKYKVIKRTKCFITIQDINNQREEPTRLKIRKYEHNLFKNASNYGEIEEVVNINRKTLWSRNEWKDTSKIFIDKYTGEPYVSDKPKLPRLPPPPLPSETPQLPRRPPPNPKVMKLREERERKQKEIHKLQREMDILYREENEILNADLEDLP